MDDHTRDTHRWYLVTSPEYEYVEVVIPETGQGPRMLTRDVAVVRARDASDAKWEASRLWERHGGVDSWPRLMRGEHRHPLSGVTAERWDNLEGPPDEEGVDPNPRGWRPFYADLSDRKRVPNRSSQ